MRKIVVCVNTILVTDYRLKSTMKIRDGSLWTTGRHALFLERKSKHFRLFMFQLAMNDLVPRFGLRLGI